MEPQERKEKTSAVRLALLKALDLEIRLCDDEDGKDVFLKIAQPIIFDNEGDQRRFIKKLRSYVSSLIKEKDLINRLGCLLNADNLFCRGVMGEERNFMAFEFILPKEFFFLKEKELADIYVGMAKKLAPYAQVINDVGRVIMIPPEVSEGMEKFLSGSEK